MKYLIIPILSGLILLYSCGSQPQEQTSAKYKTLNVGFSNQTLKRDYTATLRGRQYVEIRPQVSGIITKICMNEGDVVHRGQVLFVIDQVPYKAALKTAMANVKSAESKLATAKLTAESKEELFRENVVSEFDLQTARNALAEAQAALALARAEEINARNNLSYTEVKSPVDGVASMIPYRVGALVDSNGKVIVPTHRDSVIVIPQTATYELQNRIFVYKVVDGKAKSAPIEVFRLNNGTEYIVESGLVPGDVIIAEGAGLVREGTVIDSHTSTNE